MDITTFDVHYSEFHSARLNELAVKYFYAAQFGELTNADRARLDAILRVLDVRGEL